MTIVCKPQGMPDWDVLLEKTRLTHLTERTLGMNHDVFAPPAREKLLGGRTANEHNAAAGLLEWYVRSAPSTAEKRREVRLRAAWKRCLLLHWLSAVMQRANLKARIPSYSKSVGLSRLAFVGNRSCRSFAGGQSGVGCGVIAGCIASSPPCPQYPPLLALSLTS